jgi:TonB-linked SusC/RagA family outer membrane protein
MVVVLEDDAEMLEETVVIGYGVQKKSDLTGAVASVRSDDLQNRSTSDAAAALQGKAAGVRVITDGSPGSGAKIRVRGYSTNNTSNADAILSPLYIVDGLQVSSIQYLDPSLIESIEILKDAASAAIYGAEAGNGVVLVTTKTGQDGHTSVTYSGKATLQNYSRRPLMNREEFLQYMTLKAGADDVAKRLKDYDYSHPYYPGGVIDTDWIGAYIEPSWSTAHSLSVSGGNRNGHFFAAINYTNENGVVRGDADTYKRLTAQVNADYNLFKWLQVGVNTSIEKWQSKSVSQRGYGSSFESLIIIDPLTPVYWTTPDEMSTTVRSAYNAVQSGTSDVNYTFFGDEKGWFANTKYADTEGSPLAKRDANKSNYNGGFNINGTFFANLMPFKGFTFTSRLGFRIWHSVNHSYSFPYYIGDRGNQTTYSIGATANTGYYYQWENFANYHVTIARKHDITAMAGMSYRENNSDNVSGSASGADILKDYAPNFLYMSYLKDDAPMKTSNAPSKSASMAYFGRLIYTFDNRYSIQANFRADAFDSSKLPANKRWGYFPSVSAGWTVSNEPFFKNNVSRDAVSFLKLRVSWGINGNIAVLSGYPYTATISPGSSYYQYNVDAVGSSLGSAPSKLPNSNLTWEKSEQIDAGLDARFLNNRLTLGVDYFNKQTKDLLFNVTVPAELGFTSAVANGGNILNEGWEFELGWKDTIGDFSYSISGNFSTLHNEVLSLAEGSTPERHNNASSTNIPIYTVFEQGQPLWYLSGFDFKGVDPETGNFILDDKNGDGNLDKADMIFLGQTTPSFTYGININLAWKGIDLAVYGAGQGGNYIMPVTYRPGYKNNLKYVLTNAWTPENKNGTMPNPKYTDDLNFWASSGNLFKGDFFRIKQIQLGYTLPSRLTKKVAISSLRFYVSLDDYFTFTKYPGLDPETASQNSSDGMGLDWGSYPTMQKLLLGVNLTF